MTTALGRKNVENRAWMKIFIAVMTKKLMGLLSFWATLYIVVRAGD